MKQVCVKSATCCCTPATTAEALLPTVVTAMPEPKSMRWLPSTSTMIPPPARSTYAGSPTPTPEATVAALRAWSSWLRGAGTEVTSLRCWSIGEAGVDVMRLSSFPTRFPVQSSGIRGRNGCPATGSEAERTRPRSDVDRGRASSSGACPHRGSRLRHEHRVDEVDGRVRGLHATAEDVCAVDLEVVAGAGDLHGPALDRLVSAGDLVGRDLTGHHVVGQHRGQGLGARGLRECRDGVLRQLREGVVDRGEDGELVTVQRVHEVDLGVD